MKGVKRKALLFVLMFFVGVSFVSAGVGIKSYQESLLLGEGEKGCLNVGAYNPFVTDTYVLVGVSEELQEVLTKQSADTKLLPAKTSSDDALNLEFCFKVPRVYSRDCLVGDFICEQTCTEDQKVYEGEVFLQSVPAPTEIGGTGGSSTKMSVSHPMRIRVACEAHSRDYTLVYVLVALICAIVIAWTLFSKYRKPKAQRDKEKIAKLKADLAKEEGKGKKTKKKSRKKK